MGTFGRCLATLLTALSLAGCGEPPPAEEATATTTEAAAAPAAQPAAAPAAGLLAGLETGWNTIEPGGDTVCSDGSTYRFFVRPGDPQKLLVYFQGGGACWFAANCDLHLDPSYKATVAVDEPERYRGIFEFDNPENPFADYSVVMAPYCSGDVHLGDQVATYQAPAREARPAEGEREAREAHQAHELTIHHKGLVNAAAVLDWTYAHYPAPREVFVTGSSAGAIPSPYYAWEIADHYTDARIAQLGDGAGGYRRSGTDGGGRLANWGTLAHLSQYPEFADTTEESFAYEDLYIAAARRHPGILFAEYDAAEDAVQKRFLAMSGNETDTLLDLLKANHADVRTEVDNFRVYIAGGDSHTILARPEFYTFQVDGVRIRDWVADLAAFEPVDDVVCSDCDEAELAVMPGGDPGGS